MTSVLIPIASRHIALPSFVLILGLLAGLSSCLDHRLGNPLSPVRLRLKTNGGSTYTYDGQNRLATISANGGLSVYTYDETQNLSGYTFGATTYDSQKKISVIRQYPDPSDRTRGRAIVFPYNLDKSNFTAETFDIFFSNLYQLTNTTYYIFDNSKHASSVTNYRQPSGAGAYSGNFYTYTGENITKEQYVYAHSTDYFAYEYDDKINPFFGSTDPNISYLQQLSRNNVVKMTPSYGVSPTVYQYEYNAQGLPTKRTTRGSNEVVTYTYESY